MNRMWAVAKREFRAYFNSPVAYIVVGLFLAIFGGLFWVTFFAPPAVLTLRNYFNIASIFLMLFAPAMTMRLFAEERGSGTLEVLTTMPVRDVEVVIGKYIASVGLLAVTLALTLPYALTLSEMASFDMLRFLGIIGLGAGFLIVGLLFAADRRGPALVVLGVCLLGTIPYLRTFFTPGDLDTGPILGGYFGLLMAGSAYLAVGLFFSSLTRHQMVAFFSSLLFCVGFFFMDKLVAFAPVGAASTLQYLSFDSHFQSIARGVIDTRDVIFFFSVIGLSLIAAYASLESRRWWR